MLILHAIRKVYTAMEKLLFGAGLLFVKQIDLELFFFVPDIA